MLSSSASEREAVNYRNFFAELKRRRGLTENQLSGNLAPDENNS
jgi:hypothetical protein